MLTLCTHGSGRHVVVGPGGVFLLDSKNLTGRLVVEGGVLHTRFAYSPANDSAWTGLAPAINGSAKHLQQRLQRELGWIVDVWPVVVLVSERFEQRRVTERRLTYVAVDALAEWLEEQPRRIADRDLPAVAAAVAAVPPADDVPFVPEPGEESFDTTAAVESQR